jgi:hypothetical protein
MRRFTFLTAVAAVVVGFAGVASAGIAPVDPSHSECVETFNADWGAPGENAGPGARANEDARWRNDERKAQCDQYKVDDDEVDPLDVD